MNDDVCRCVPISSFVTALKFPDLSGSIYFWRVGFQSAGTSQLICCYARRVLPRTAKATPVNSPSTAPIAISTAVPGVFGRMGA